MATTINLLYSPPFLNRKFRSLPHLRFPKPNLSFPKQIPPLNLSPKFKMINSNHFSKITLRLGFQVNATNNGEVEKIEIEEEEEARGESTMPERFRYLTKEAPDPPVRWPWAIALALLVYCWRTVLWELSNWKQGALAILSFFGYLSKLGLAFVFHFLGDPITGLIRSMEFCLYSIRYIYSNIVAFAPVPELTRIILFTSTILSIAEATVPESVSSQPYLLTIAGIVSFGAISGIILEPFFYVILFGMVCYASFIKKRDVVSATLPFAAAVTAIGEPWVRALTIVSYLALAIFQHSKSLDKDSNDEVLEMETGSKRLPLPLLFAALSIGIHVAAKWIRNRHLMWMIA